MAFPTACERQTSSMDSFGQESVEKTTARFGGMPAPWVYLANCDPYSIGWRMGSGEEYMIYFPQWLAEQGWTKRERAQFFLDQDVPPMWLHWVAITVLDLGDRRRSKQHDEVLEELWPQMEELGFTGKEQFATDLLDRKWQ